MNEPKRRTRKTNPSGREFRDRIARAFQAIDELGFDSVALMREQLRNEGVLPKPNEPDVPKDDNS
jgi:hypothetical protein